MSGVLSRWVKGQSGNPGGRMKVVSVARIVKVLVKEKPEVVRQAMLDGLQSKPPYSAPYLRLCLEYTDGKPLVPVAHQVDGQVLHIHAAAEELAARMGAGELRQLESALLKLEGSGLTDDDDDQPVIDVQPITHGTAQPPAGDTRSPAPTSSGQGSASPTASAQPDPDLDAW